MTISQVGPKYCPNCGKELATNVSICNHCGYKIKERKVKPKSFSFYIEEKVYLDEQTNKKRLIIGILICALTLPYITLICVIANYSSLYYLFLGLQVQFLILAFPAYLFGLGLIYLSIQTKHKGFFLTILGYLFFLTSFLILPPIDYYEPQLIFVYLILIDLPLLVMVFLGIQTIFTYKDKSPLSNLTFLPVLFSNIFIFSITLANLGY